MVGFYRTDNSALLVSSYEGETLYSLLKKNMLSLEHRVRLMAQLAFTLDRLHERDVAHNDIKANNVCVKLSEWGPTLSIIDFGLASIGGRRRQLDGEWDPQGWYAPEMFGDAAGPHLPWAADVYAVGRLVAQVLG